MEVTDDFPVESSEEHVEYWEEQAVIPNKRRVLEDAKRLVKGMEEEWEHRHNESLYPITADARFVSDDPEAVSNPTENKMPSWLENTGSRYFYDDDSADWYLKHDGEESAAEFLESQNPNR